MTLPLPAPQDIPKDMSVDQYVRMFVVPAFAAMNARIARLEAAEHIEDWFDDTQSTEAQ